MKSQNAASALSAESTSKGHCPSSLGALLSLPAESQLAVASSIGPTAVGSLLLPLDPPRRHYFPTATVPFHLRRLAIGDHPINAERFPPVATALCCHSPRSVQITWLEQALLSPLHQTRSDTVIGVDRYRCCVFYIKRLPLLFPRFIGKKCFGNRKALLFDCWLQVPCKPIT
ncbi:hypothetical protein BHE74_00048536 [Ensete ventricosum]|nr:hypothetical protein GW17_00037062 [Ensete ventricosum]RWW45606.1 hypothetical protein BHE74_00048536 [Ensete ventricosum]